jgi:flagellar hook protein FlgE
MTISSMMNIALSGMRTGPGATTGAAGETDAEISLANELLTLKQAETGFKANALVFETGADLWDVLMSIKRD